MPFQIFSVSCLHPQHSSEALNRFLSANKIVSIDKQFIASGDASYWSFCIEYTGAEDAAGVRKGRVDYREKLSEADFQVFSKLRELRKSLAHDANIPPYGVFNDLQLAAFVENRVDSLEAMGKVPGVGEVKLKSFGQAMLDLIRSLQKGVT